MQTKVGGIDSTFSITQIEKPHRGAERLSCLAGLVTGAAYSVYATFIAQVLTPPSVYVTDRSTHLRLLTGQIGDLKEVFNWDGLIFILVPSMIVFILVWCIVRIAIKSTGQIRGSLSRTGRTDMRAETTSVHARRAHAGMVG